MSEAEEEEWLCNASFGGLQTPTLSSHPRPPSTTNTARQPSRLRRIPGPDTDIKYVFRHTFGKTEFRGQQEAIMKASLQGLDILVIAPTGLGKSLCFQCPAIADNHGVTIVVCPLISLMNDQVEALRSLNLPAAMLTSTTPEENARKIYKDLKCGHPKTRLLYVTPERICTEAFQKKLAVVYKQNELARFVVDESHCIEEWGQTFRKSYAQLGQLRELFPKVPIMALTASATDHVAEAIVNSLKLDRQYFVKITHPFNRANLFYEVRYVKDGSESRLDDIATFIRKQYRRNAEKLKCNQENVPISGIVYARAKATCDGIADFLRQKGIRAAAYHRGMKPKLAHSTQDRWLRNDHLRSNGKPHVDCIVATVAFGMGIDKPNCRYVIHYDLPKSFEGYYQETGRAGRDGHSAQALLYFSPEDEHRVVFFANEAARKLKKAADGAGEDRVISKHAADSAAKLVAFVKDTQTCRHLGICRYFGEELAEDAVPKLCQQFCDVCRNPSKVSQHLKAVDTQFSPSATQRLQKQGFHEDRDQDPFPESDDLLESDHCPLALAPSSKRPRTTAQENDRPSKKPRPPSPIQINDMGLDDVTNLPASTNHLRKAFAYKAPFQKEANTQGSKLTKGSSSLVLSEQPSPPRKIHLVPSPSLSSKNVPQDVRNAAVTSMDKHMCRAVLSKYGCRSKAEEQAIFDALGAGQLSPRDKRAVILEAVIEIESDTHWTILTLPGYQDSIQNRTQALKALAADPDWFKDCNKPEVRCLKRAARVAKLGAEEPLQVVFGENVQQQKIWGPVNMH